jgi:hypothetical protein
MKARSHVSFTAALTLVLAAPFIAHAQGTPAESDTTRTQAPPPKVAAPALDFSGVIFGNYQFQTDSLARAQNGGRSPNRFDIERAYLTFKMPAGDRASIRVTTDIKQQPGTSGYNGWFVRLKYAYFQYDVLRPTTSGTSVLARIGVLHTVAIDHEEKFWPRYLGKVAIERAGFFSSADVGLATQVTLPNSWGELYGTITNGNGYENHETNRFKDAALRLSVTPLARQGGLLQTFTISPWVYRGQTASAFAADPADPITSGLAHNRWGVFAGNRDPRLTFGVEYAERTDGMEAGAAPSARTVTDVTGRLYDVFAIVRPIAWVNPNAPSSLGVVFRLDDFKPNTDVAGTSRFITAGVFWEPTASTALALDYQRTAPEDGLAGTVSRTWYVHWQANF